MIRSFFRKCREIIAYSFLKRHVCDRFLLDLGLSATLFLLLLMMNSLDSFEVSTSSHSVSSFTMLASLSERLLLDARRLRSRNIGGRRVHLPKRQDYRTARRRLSLHMPEASDGDVVRDTGGGRGTASRMLRLAPPAMLQLLGPLTVNRSWGHGCSCPTHWYSPCGLVTHLPVATPRMTRCWRSSLLHL